MDGGRSAGRPVVWAAAPGEEAVISGAAELELRCFNLPFLPPISLPPIFLPPISLPPASSPLSQLLPCILPILPPISLPPVSSPLSQLLPCILASPLSSPLLSSVSSPLSPLLSSSLLCRLSFPPTSLPLSPLLSSPLSPLRSCIISCPQVRSPRPRPPVIYFLSSVASLHSSPPLSFLLLSSPRSLVSSPLRSAPLLCRLSSLMSPVSSLRSWTPYQDGIFVADLPADAPAVPSPPPHTTRVLSYIGLDVVHDIVHELAQPDFEFRVCTVQITVRRRRAVLAGPLAERRPLAIIGESSVNLLTPPPIVIETRTKGRGGCSRMTVRRRRRPALQPVPRQLLDRLHVGRRHVGGRRAVLCRRRADRPLR